MKRKMDKHNKIYVIMILLAFIVSCVWMLWYELVVLPSYKNVIEYYQLKEYKYNEFENKYNFSAMEKWKTQK